jgi:hypothetical protein
MSDLIERLNAGIAVCDRRLPTARTQQDIEVALVFREILTETRDEIERLERELAEARNRQSCENGQPWVCHALATARSELAQYENVVIPSWKREEEGWRQDEKDAVEFRRVLAEQCDRLERELAEARDGFKEAMSDHADTLDRLAEAERDAARYRWLREADIVDWDAIPFPVGYDHPDDTLDDLAKMLDASIDACMTSSTVSGIEK